MAPDAKRMGRMRANVCLLHIPKSAARLCNGIRGEREGCENGGGGGLADGDGGEERGHEEVVARGDADDFVAEGIEARHDGGCTPTRAEDNDPLLAHAAFLQEQVVHNLFVSRPAQPRNVKLVPDN